MLDGSNWQHVSNRNVLAKWLQKPVPQPGQLVGEFPSRHGKVAAITPGYRHK